MGLVCRALTLWVGLAAAATAVPALAVEPTLVADAHVNSALPAVNSGAISNLNVGAGYTALLQFDLNLLPAGTTAAQVSRAVLRLYCNRVDTAGQVSLKPVSGAWGEYSVTYATLPPLASALQSFQVNQARTYVTVDVTALVQGWITSPATNNGLALTADVAGVQFDSKENDLTGTCGGAGCDTGFGWSHGPGGPCGADRNDRSSGIGWGNGSDWLNRAGWACRADGSAGSARAPRTSGSRRTCWCYGSNGSDRSYGACGGAGAGGCGGGCGNGVPGELFIHYQLCGK